MPRSLKEALGFWPSFLKYSVRPTCSCSRLIALNHGGIALPQINDAVEWQHGANKFMIAIDAPEGWIREHFSVVKDSGARLNRGYP